MYYCNYCVIVYWLWWFSDSPVAPLLNSAATHSHGTHQAPAPRDSSMDRGYDFGKVCRWYAERADVILLFFDPDKPGSV